MGRVMAIDIGASSYRVIEGIYSDGKFEHENSGQISTYSDMERGTLPMEYL